MAKRDPKRRDHAQKEQVDLVCNDEGRARDIITPALTLFTGGQNRGDDEDDDPLVGSVLAAKYEIHALCGRGGMGSVYKAQHFELKRYVAVKVLHKHLLSHQGISDRFRLSAQAAHALRHPNLVSVTDFGYTEEGQFFLAMDYVQGETLARKLKREGELTIDSFFKVFSQVLSGLKFCHQKGIVHRDIKPSNILITNREVKSDSIKLVDFGIAKVLPESESSIDHLTQTGELLGSPLYMSPEQCRGDEIDARTDLYALGCVMFEALSGKPPFQGKSAIETLMLHCSQPAPTLYEATGDAQLTEQLDAFIKKAMAKDREERFSSAEEMEEALASIQRFLHLPKIARQRLNPSSPPGTGSQSVKPVPAPSRRKLGLYCVAAFSFCAATFLAFAGQDSLKKNYYALVSQQAQPSREQAFDTIKLGVIERKEGNLAGSEKRLTKAVSNNERTFSKNSTEYLTSAGELAATQIAIAERTGNRTKRDSYYQSAQKLLNETITGCQHIIGTQVGTPDLKQLQLVQANATFLLAHVYARQGNFGGAAPLFEQGFTLIDTTQPMSETSQDFFREYADFLWRAGKSREAAKLQLTFHLEPWEAKLASEAPLKTTDLTGFWSAKYGDFCLQLNANGAASDTKNSATDGTIRGSHCYVTQGGRQIDGTIRDTNPSIEGKMEHGVFKGTVTSSHGQKAQLTMVRVEDYVVWKILGVESEGESLLPETAVLHLTPANAKH